MAITGLFNQTPYGLQQERQAALEESAAAYGKTNPNDPYGFDRARSGLYMAGSQLGGGIASLMGVEDPAMKDISFASMLRSKYNGLATTADVQAALKEAVIAKNPAAVQYLSTQLPIVQKAESEILSKRAETLNKLAQLPKLAAEAVGKEAENQARLDRVTALTSLGLDKTQAKGVASSDTAYASYLQSKKIATPAEYAVQAQIEGFSAKPFLSDYTPAEMLKMEKGVFGHKAGIAAAGRTTVINQQEGALAKGMGEDQAKALSEARLSATGAGPALDRLNTLEKLNNSGKLFQGPQANTTATAANFLNSVGLLSKENAASLSSSEVYGKTAKDLVLQDLNGKLGAGISNEDRAFIEAKIPQLTNSPQARTELIQKLKEIQQSKVGYYKDMISHVQKYKNLNEFDFSKNMPVSAVPTPALTGNALVDKYLNPKAP